MVIDHVHVTWTQAGKLRLVTTVVYHYQPMPAPLISAISRTFVEPLFFPWFSLFLLGLAFFDEVVQASIQIWLWLGFRFRHASYDVFRPGL